MIACLSTSLLAISHKVECSPPHVEAIYICPAPVSSKLCPHMQLCRPAICVFVFPSSFLSLDVIQWVFLSIYYRLSWLAPTCPAHLHLASFIFSCMSLTLVLFLVRDSDFVTQCDIFSIFLSIACCAVLSFGSKYFVVQVSQPYVIVGNTHWLKTLFSGSKVVFCHIGYLCIYLPKQLQPAFIRIRTSSLVLSSIFTVWPRYF